MLPLSGIPTGGFPGSGAGGPGGFGPTDLPRIDRTPARVGGATDSGVLQVPMTLERETAATDVPAISVVIPCRNERRHIEACLISLLGQESPPDGFEVIVADGMSDDGTREVLERLSTA